jgi:hypothetical protein
MGRGQQSVTAVSLGRGQVAAKARQELAEDWGAAGFRPVAELNQRERDIVDSGLERANRQELIDNKVIRTPPYTRLFAYRPHMKGNHGHWLAFELHLEHDNGHIYGIAEITRPTGRFSSQSMSAARIEDYGTNLEQAIAKIQAVADETVEQFFSTPAGRHAQLTPYPFNDPISRSIKTGANGQLHDPTERAFIKAHDQIRERLAQGVADADQQRQAQQKREQAHAQRLETLRDRGYIDPLSAPLISE